MNLIHYQWFVHECTCLDFEVCICVGTHAFNTCLHNNNNVGCVHLWLVKNHTWKSHQNWNMTKIKPKTNGNNVVFVHFNTTFWITKKSNHFMPYFLAATFYIHMSNKLHPIKTLANPIRFQSFRNLFTSIHASWVTFNYNIYVNHAFNTPQQQASWIAYIWMCWNHTWKLHHTHGNKKVGLHSFVCVAN